MSGSPPPLHTLNSNIDLLPHLLRNWWFPEYSKSLVQSLFPQILLVLQSILKWKLGITLFRITYHLILGDSQITAGGDCSLEIKRCLLLGRKAMTNIDSILKSWDITLPTKFHLVKAMVFPVVIYRCESWKERKLSAEELMLLNCGVEEDSWESLRLQGDPTSLS